MPNLLTIHRAWALLTGAIVGAAIALASSTVSAAPNCAEFFSNADGSWSPTHPILVAGTSTQTQLMPSDRYRAGMPGLAGRIAASLNRNCRSERVPSALHRIPKVP